MSELINLIRYYHFIAGVLSYQQTDPLCGNCKAFANTAERMKEGVLERTGERPCGGASYASGGVSAYAGGIVKK